MTKIPQNPIPPSLLNKLKDQFPKPQLSTDYKNKCGNCRGELMEGDKYCRYCGTLRGEGEFKPYHNVAARLYGPLPRKYVHECRKCSYTWMATQRIPNMLYCPKCGEEAPMVREGER